LVNFCSCNGYLFIGNRKRFNEEDDTTNSNIIEIEKNAKKADPYSELAINEGVAAALYKAFESLSGIERENDTYHTVLDLLNGVKSESSRKEGYSKPFEDRLWIQIKKNILKGYYPAVLKSYLQFIGFCLVSDERQRTGWTGEQTEKMRRLLYIDLKPQIEANKTMADGITPMKEALLPDCMDYKDGIFTYTIGFSRGPTKAIDPPDENLESPLKNINEKEELV
jgi:hypothetical protein